MPNIRGLLLAPCRHQYYSYRVLFSGKKVTAQFFPRLYIVESLSGFIKTLSIGSRYYGIYISIMFVKRIYAVIEIQLFKVKYFFSLIVLTKKGDREILTQSMNFINSHSHKIIITAINLKYSTFNMVLFIWVISTLVH